jgi:hypothetical protein
VAFACVAGIFALAGVALLWGGQRWMRGDVARAQALESAS